MNWDKKKFLEILSNEVEFMDRVKGAKFFAALVDNKGYLVYLNNYWEQKLGFSLDEMTSKPFKYFLHPDDLEKSMKVYYESRLFNKQSTEPQGFTNRYKTDEKGKYAILEWHEADYSDNGLSAAIAIFKGYEYT